MKLFESHQPLLLLGIRRAGLVSSSNAYSATLTGVTIIASETPFEVTMRDCLADEPTESQKLSVSAQDRCHASLARKERAQAHRTAT